MVEMERNLALEQRGAGMARVLRSLLRHVERPLLLTETAPTDKAIQPDKPAN